MGRRVTTENFESLLLESAPDKAIERGELGAARETTLTALNADVKAPTSFTPARVVALRGTLNASQAVFAKVLNVSVKLAQSWEQGERTPDGAALRLLEMYAERPELAKRLIVPHTDHHTDGWTTKRADEFGPRSVREQLTKKTRGATERTRGAVAGRPAARKKSRSPNLCDGRGSSRTQAPPNKARPPRPPVRPSGPKPSLPAAVKASHVPGRRITHVRGVCARPRAAGHRKGRRGRERQGGQHQARDPARLDPRGHRGPTL